MEARMRGCLNITSAQKWHAVIFQISAEISFPDLKKEISCTYWMNLEDLPHDFCKLQPPKLYKNVKNFFVKPGNFFLQKFEKLQDVIFGLM